MEINAGINLKRLRRGPANLITSRSRIRFAVTLQFGKLAPPKTT
jgi:hypothetical protein